MFMIKLLTHSIGQFDHNVQRHLNSKMTKINRLNIGRFSTRDFQWGCSNSYQPQDGLGPPVKRRVCGNGPFL